MDSLPVVVGLAAFGILALIAGVIVWRNAQHIVEDARRELERMFGGQPGLSDEAPGPLAAKIAGGAFVVVGVAFLVIATVVVLGR